MTAVLNGHRQNGHREKLRGLPQPINLRASSRKRGDLFAEPISPRDYEALYQLLVVQDAGWRYKFGGGTPDSESFVRELCSGVGLNMVVRQAGVRVSLPPAPPPPLNCMGLLQIYGGNHRDGVAYLGVVLSTAIQRDLRMSILLGKFLYHAFETFGFRKIYAEMPEYTYRDVASGEGRFFEVEGVMKDHFRRPGGLYDQYIIAIRPEHVAAAAER